MDAVRRKTELDEPSLFDAERYQVIDVENKQHSFKSFTDAT